MNEEEAKETLKTMKENIDKKYLKVRNSLAIETVLSELEKKDEYIKMLTDERDTLIKERDYYKARYNEFNNAFIEGGKKLTSK